MIARLDFQVPDDFEPFANGCEEHCPFSYCREGVWLCDQGDGCVMLPSNGHCGYVGGNING